MLSIMMCIYVTSLYIDESQRSLKCSSSSKILMLTLDSTPTLPKIPTSEFRQRSADDMIARYLVLSRFDRKDSTTCTSWAAIEDWNKLFFPMLQFLTSCLSFHRCSILKISAPNLKICALIAAVSGGLTSIHDCGILIDGSGQ